MDDRQIRQQQKLSKAARKLRVAVDPKAKFEAARQMSMQRVRPGGGRPVIMRDCPHDGCGEQLSTRAMRAHIRDCPKRPAN